MSPSSAHGRPSGEDGAWPRGIQHGVGEASGLRPLDAAPFEYTSSSEIGGIGASSLPELSNVEADGSYFVPGSNEDDPGGPEIILLRDRGVQVGDHNVQLNTYDCTLQKIDVDLESVLQRPQVQAALGALAMKRDDPGLRRAADRALGATSFFAALPEVRLDRGAADAARGAVSVFGFLFAQDCQGLQAGRHNRQENHFVYHASTTLDARRLLHDSPELRAELIDSARAAGGASPDLTASFGEAVADAVGQRIDARSLSTSVVPRNGATVIVADRDGVSIGHDCRQFNEVKVTGAGPALEHPLGNIETATTRAVSEAGRTRLAAIPEAGQTDEVDILREPRTVLGGSPSWEREADDNLVGIPGPAWGVDEMPSVARGPEHDDRYDHGPELEI